MSETIETHKRINSIARIAEYVAIIGVLLMMSTFLFAAYLIFFDPTALDAEISQEFLQKGVLAKFTTGQRIIGAKLMLITNLWGMVGLCIARNLFAGYRRGEIFSLKAGSRLRTIGWVVVLLSPVWKIAENVGASYFGSIAGEGRIGFELLIEDSDIYCIVFGLLIVVVGHIMYEAVRINDENKSFV